MAVLSVHHVVESCCQEIAAILGYSLGNKTRDAWQEARVRRIEQQEKHQSSRKEDPEVVSIDECKLGNSWGYTLTDTETDYVCKSAVTDYRNLFVVRNLVADVYPKAVISDGCKSIQAAMHWFPKIPRRVLRIPCIQSFSQSIPKQDSEPVKCFTPITNGHGPFYLNIFYSQVKHLE
jgi:transposase-like protein